MGKDTEMVALDSCAMTGLIKALSAVHAPTGRQKDDELALVRSFFYLPSECCFHLSRRVRSEYEAITDRARREEHASWNAALFCDLHPAPDDKLVDVRVESLRKYHPKGIADLTVLAECELGQVKNLVTLDNEFRDKVPDDATVVRLYSPVEFWQKLNVPNGAPPVRSPSHGTPLAGQNWWRA
jgi:hypothetical protein